MAENVSSLIEDIKGWFDLGISEKIVGFIIIFIAIYTSIWEIFHPVVIAFVWLEKNWWWCFQLPLSIIISVILFFILSPKRVIAKFGFEPTDVSLATTFNNATKKPVAIENPIYAKVLNFDAEDASDFALEKEYWQSAKTVKYIYQAESKFTFYLKIRVLSKNGGTPKDVWLALLPDIENPRKLNESEWHCPISPKYTFDGWAYVRVNPSVKIKGTFGKQGWKYNKLLAFRVRGKGNIASIVLQ